MKANKKVALINALENATTMISEHVQGGALFDCDDYTHDEYVEATEKAAKMIEGLVKKYKRTHAADLIRFFNQLKPPTNGTNSVE